VLPALFVAPLKTSANAVIAAPGTNLNVYSYQPAAASMVLTVVVVGLRIVSGDPVQSSAEKLCGVSLNASICTFTVMSFEAVASVITSETWTNAVAGRESVSSLPVSLIAGIMSREPEKRMRARTRGGVAAKPSVSGRKGTHSPVPFG
jgi:hypothetical protein